MSICEQVDALHKRLADLKSSAYQARQETDEQIKAGIDQAKAEIAVRQKVAGLTNSCMPMSRYPSVTSRAIWVAIACFRSPVMRWRVPWFTGDLLQRPADMQRLGQHLRTRQLARRQLPGHLYQRQRIPAGPGHDPSARCGAGSRSS